MASAEWETGLPVAILRQNNREISVIHLFIYSFIHLAIYQSKFNQSVHLIIYSIGQ